MCSRILCALLICSGFYSYSQPSEAIEILEKSIRYHDPLSYWDNFEGILHLEQDSPTRAKRNDEVHINNTKGYFRHRQNRADTLLERIVVGEECEHHLKIGDTSTDDQTLFEKFRLNCDRSKLLRNYYLYLYGLPMKLRDRGTIIAPRASNDTFDNIDCWSIRVTYEKEIGEDTWYFYFDKKTYALTGYRFYHDEAAGDGEYILLKNELEFNGMKIPRTRTWYTHQGDRLLGTDNLLSVSEQ